MQNFRFLILIFFIIFTGSCSKNSIQENDILYFDSKEIGDFGMQTLKFLNSLIQDDINGFEIKVKLLQSKISGIQEINEDKQFRFILKFFK